jgi:predicted RNA-binding protein with PIN domain
MSGPRNYTILIDGYNVIKRHPGWARLGLQEARRRLLEHVGRGRWPMTPCRVRVIFDGPGLEETLHELTPTVSARFASPSADAYILKAIRESREPDRLLVISDDGEILRTAKSHGVRRQPVAWLLKPEALPQRPRHAESEQPALPAAEARRITEELAKRWRSSPDA